MSKDVLEFFRTEEPSLKEVPDRELSLFIGDNYPELLEEEPEFAKVYRLRKEQEKTERTGRWADRGAQLAEDAGNVLRGVAGAPIGEAMGDLGRVGTAVVTDLAGYARRGEIPLIDRPLDMPNTAAALGPVRQPLPSDVADEAAVVRARETGESKAAPLIRLGARDALRSLPAVAAAMGLRAVGRVPGPVAFGTPMALQTFAETEDPVATATSLAVGAAIPPVAEKARAAAGEGLAALVRGGLLRPESELAQKAIESVVSQAAVQGVIEAARLPEYAQMTKDERREALVRSVAGNLAFGAMELPYFRKNVRSETQKALFQVDSVANASWIVNELLSRAPLDVADPEAVIRFAQDPIHTQVWDKLSPPELYWRAGQDPTPAEPAAAPDAIEGKPAPEAPRPDGLDPVTVQGAEEQARAALLKRAGVWQASTPLDGSRVSGIWTVAEAGDLVTSADAGFDQALQPRDRSRQASANQIAEIVRMFEPERLGEAPTTDLGAPIVDERNQVLSGNGRVTALRQVYAAENPSKAEAYRAWILKQAEEMGTPAEVIEGIRKMKQPVLVRLATEFGGLSKEEFARQSNRQQVLGMGEGEKAASDAKVVEPILELFRPSEEGDVLAASNREFLREFVKGTGDQAELLTKEGYNAAAVTRRVRNAVLGALLGSDATGRELLGTVLERGDELGVKNVVTGIMNAAPALVKTRVAAEEYDLGPVLRKALRDLVKIRSEGIKPEDFVKQMDLLRDPERTSESDFLVEQLGRIKSVKGVTEALYRYAERVRQMDPAGGEDIFGARPKSREELVREVFQPARERVRQGELTETGSSRQAAARALPGETLRVFQGKGRGDKGAVYSEGITEPILGRGDYYAFSREAAAFFGPVVTEQNISVRRPLRIDSDADYVKLVRGAGVEFAKFWQTDPARLKEALADAHAKFERYLRLEGYDAVIVRGTERPENRVLREAFGEEQVFIPRSAGTNNAGKPAPSVTSETLPRTSKRNTGDDVQASIEGATLPRQIEGETAGLVAGEPVSLAAIREHLSKALDIPVRYRGFRQRALGIFKPKAETIRLRAINDIPVLAHEVGHYLHYLLFPEKGGPEGRLLGAQEGASDFGKLYDNELMPLGRRTSRPTYPPDQVRREGVAEYVREWLTDKTRALAHAPKFSVFFESELQAKYPEVWKILEKARGDIQAYIRQPAMMKVRSRINRKAPEKQRSWREFWNEQVDDWVNELGPVERAMNQARAFGLPAEQAKMVTDLAVNYIGGWRGKVEYALYQRAIDLNGNDVGPSLREILGGIEDLAEFGDYLVAKREIELKRRGIETGLDPHDAAAQAREVAALDAKYEGKARALYSFQKEQLRLLVDAGVISRESFGRMLRANELYVPFYRVMEHLSGTGARKGEGFINLGQGVFKLKGSDRQYVDPLESVVKNAYLFRDLAERNKVARGFVGAVEQVRGGGRIAEGVAAKIKPVAVKGEEIAGQLRAQLAAVGIELPEGTPVEDFAFRVWRAAKQSSPKEGLFYVWEDGKQRVFQVGDEHLYRALSLADSNDAAVFSKVPFLKAARLATRVKRAGATLTFEFMARNPFRDQITAGVYSKYGFIPFWDGFRGMISAVGKDQWYWDWVKAGGRYADFVSMDRKDLQSTLRDVIRDRGVLRAALELADPRNVILNLQRFSEFMEQATRISEFRRAKQAGASDLEAANASKDVTLNFARAGFKGKLVNQLVAFFNAGMQDVSKFARAHQERPFETGLKAFMYVSLPSILTWWLGRDDEEIQNLPEWRKTFFWNVNLGSLAGGEERFVLSLPKPFLIGQIYGSSLERGLDWAYGKDPNAVTKWFMGLWEATPFTVNNLLPSIAMPAVENWANKSFFLDQPLENQAMQALPAELRWGPQTSLIARNLGDLMPLENGYSPIKIDNLIRGYFAGLGKYGTAAADFLVTKLAGDALPPAPSKTIWERPLLRAFVRSPYEASANVERFYQGVERAEQALNGLKLYAQLDSEKARDFLDEHQKRILWYAAAPYGKENITLLRQTRDAMGEVIKAMRDVQLSRELSPETKRERLVELSRTRDRLAEVGVKLFVSPEDRAALR